MKTLFTSLFVFLIVPTCWAQLSTSIINITYPCVNDGAATVVISNGTPPYTISWSMGGVVFANTATISNLVAGYYQVTVTDASMLSTTNYLYLPSQVQTNTIGTNGICPLNSGSAITTVTGGTPPYNYYWSNGQQFLNQSGNTSTVTGLANGMYSVSVTDANGCINNVTMDSMAWIVNTAPFNITVVTTPSNCVDGSATVNITGGGTPPFNYFWNTTPVQTTPTATNLNGNTFTTITVTDNDGCQGFSSVSIPFGSQALQTNLSATNALCPLSNGTLTITPLNGQPPYTYIWNTGATTSSISNLTAGLYTVTITDFSGCSNILTKQVYEESPVIVSVSTTQSNCNASGTATANVTGGTTPYSYSWYTSGQTTATINGLQAGYYALQVTDANGCTNHGGAPLSDNSACLTTVLGFVYDDLNANCIYDFGEPGLGSHVIDLGNGSYGNTDASGFYSRSTPYSNYAMSVIPKPLWNVVCPITPYLLTLSPGQSSINDFFLTPSVLQNDVSIYSSGNSAIRPGFSHNRSFWITNKGTTLISGTVVVIHDPQEVFMGGPSVTNYDPSTRTITFNYTLVPFESKTLTAGMYLPSNIPIGNVLNTTCYIFPVSGDVAPLDNSDSDVDIVVGSFDPNDKIVEPQGQGSNGVISLNDSIITYTIRFQNTGTYPAEKVRIVDTLDSDFYIPSFDFIGATHPVEWSIDGPGILTFTFNNINLPDSSSNEPGSHGALQYMIQRKSNPANGTEFINTAYIYFDFNEAVVTNSTLNTVITTGIEEIQSSNIIAYPNPAKDILYIKYRPELCDRIEIMDVKGAFVSTEKPVRNEINIKSLNNGVYFLRVIYPSETLSTKLLIHR